MCLRDKVIALLQFKQQQKHLYFLTLHCSQTDKLLSLGKPEEDYRKGENPVNSEYWKKQKVFSCLFACLFVFNPLAV